MCVCNNLGLTKHSRNDPLTPTILCPPQATKTCIRAKKARIYMRVQSSDVVLSWTLSNQHPWGLVIYLTSVY